MEFGGAALKVSSHQLYISAYHRLINICGLYFQSNLLKTLWSYLYFGDVYFLSTLTTIPLYTQCCIFYFNCMLLNFFFDIQYNVLVLYYLLSPKSPLKILLRDSPLQNIFCRYFLQLYAYCR